MCLLMPQVQRFFTANNALPAMPEVAQRLLRCFGQENVSLAQLVALIERDAGLAARLLRLANSARYSPRARVTRLADAAALIGLDALRGLALSASLANVFPHPPGFDRLRFWCQNLATAGYAKAMAGLLDLEPDTAEVAGLMLRSGELLMLRVEPGLTALIEELAGPPDSVFEVERLNFGCSHAEVSAELAVRWRFPAAIVDALFTAAEPLAVQPFSPMGALVRAASVMADAGSDGLEPVAALMTHQPQLAERLGLQAEPLREQLPPWNRLTAAVIDLVG